MRLNNLIEWNNKKVSIKLRHSSRIEGLLIIKDKILYIYDSEKHAIALLPQEVVQITEIFDDDQKRDDEK